MSGSDSVPQTSHQAVPCRATGGLATGARDHGGQDDALAMGCL